MSDGGIGKNHGGVRYVATITISGNLEKKQLKAVVSELKGIMNQKVTSDGEVGSDGELINGAVVQAARVSEGKSLPTGSSISVGLSTAKRPE
jgi:F0F1-type ATP synthase delta subunit